jgi:multidrug efflux pump
MTSAATICGHFPLTLVSGAGAAARNSIGITVVAGMAIGTVFTLLVIPSIYVLIARQHSEEAVAISDQDLDIAETLDGARRPLRPTAAEPIPAH